MPPFGDLGPAKQVRALIVYPTGRTETAIGQPIADGRIWLEALPPYAPDLNPWDEGGWHHLKDVEMGNVVCHDLEELHEQFHLAVARLRRPHLLQSFFARAGLAIEDT